MEKTQSGSTHTQEDFSSLIKLDDLKTYALSEKYIIRCKISEGSYGHVYNVMRKSD